MPRLWSPVKSYTLINRIWINGDTFLITLKPLQEGWTFQAGQFVNLVYPRGDTSNRPHYFSIASSPKRRDSWEFCIRICGKWTAALAKAQPGEVLEVGQPQGRFIWDHQATHLLYLVGGMGIAPVMSMLRFFEDEQLPVTSILIYGNRSEATIVYRQEIEQYYALGNRGKVVHILSEADDSRDWWGYRGYISKELLAKEVNIPVDLVYFVGPPSFMVTMGEVLNQLGYQDSVWRRELIAV